MRGLVLFLFTALATQSFAQDVHSTYERAYRELKGMLTDSIPTSFKRAVFVTENAYNNDGLSYDAYETEIHRLTKLSWNVAQQNPIVYQDTDREEVNKYAAVYRIMTDSVKFELSGGDTFVSTPYHYDFDDFWGERSWNKMFVTKLLATHSGNCHSLPFLYKILCEELGAKAYLAMAPSHTYIKQWSKKSGWYNTELTSHYFPIDAWIMASGYIHLSAVQNRVYMDTLSQANSIAVCLIDLAKGYERKVPDGLDFKERCANLALQFYPNYTNALILRAEITKKRFEKIMVAAGATTPNQILGRSDAKKLFASMEHQYSSIYKLGYRAMPKEMYVRWLSELQIEKEKYLNKTVISNFTQSNKK